MSMSIDIRRQASTRRPRRPQEGGREKRNDANYEAVSVTQTEADALLAEALEFRIAVEEWIAERHPKLAAVSEQE